MTTPDERIAAAAAAARDLADVLSSLTDPDPGARAAAAASLVRRHIETAARCCTGMGDDAEHEEERVWWHEQAVWLHDLAGDVAAGILPREALAAYHAPAVTP